MSQTIIRKKKAIIIGAGPAGLTAAYELLKNTDIVPIILEESGDIGGLSKTVNYKGNRMDIGGHRFFSKNKMIMDFWKDIMPVQDETHNPRNIDAVILRRQRISRIYFLRKFFDYPISLKLQTFTNMGLVRTIKAGFSYVFAQLIKHKSNSLEDFYINRFGKTLYSLFFEGYTEKVWGFHPSVLGADWGGQRVKGLSIMTVLKDSLLKKIGMKNKSKVETSLIEEFIYPKYGPGQLWELVAQKILSHDDGTIDTAKIIKHALVQKVEIKNNQVVSVSYKCGDELIKIPCDYLLSSMPIKDLVSAMYGVTIPPDVLRIGKNLIYRDFITVGLLLKKLKIRNKTKLETYKNRIPDTWIYIQERDVKIGRLQIFNNWSPYLVNDNENTMWIGLEYFCNEGDDLWNMTKDKFIKMAIDELVKIDIINAEDVIDATQVKIKKAYPTYYGTYYELDTVKSYFNSIGNLYCIGRNGQHRYNNMDHSMLTAIEAVKNISLSTVSKDNIWNVNTEEDYNEEISEKDNN